MDNRGNTKSFNINSFNKIINTTIADNKAQIIRWLSSLEPQKRHQHLRESRLERVGQWIFQTDEFQRWSTGEARSGHSVLFCRGDPGVGKTYISSLVIDHFYGSGQDVTVAGLYCDYLDRKEQTTSNMLGAMLGQLVGRGNIPEDVHKAFEDAKDHFGGVRPQVPELVNMLKAAIGQRQRVVICIDGLDESLAAHRTGLLKSLQSIAQESSSVRIFLTGRPFIRGEVERYFPSTDTISVTPTKEDTEKFLRMKLDDDPEPDAMDECLRADITKIIPEAISEIFLLVSLSIGAILAEPTIHRRKEKLKQISTGQDVGDVYTATFERIKGQENARSRLGMEAIMWVAYSERPLRLDELCQALGVEVGSKDLNKDGAPTIRTIMNCALGLVTVDSSSSTVRLVHFTLLEYILANPTLFRSPHSAIAEVCLTYLNFAYIRDLSPALSVPPPTTPFLEYASCHWGAHARREISERAMPLALKLLDRFDGYISCKILLLKEPRRPQPLDTEGNLVGFTGLHGAALFGILEIILSLIEVRKWDVNAADLCGSTALAWAVRNGHDGAVKMLLERGGVGPGMADSRDRTPFSWASEYGYEGIAKRLLDWNDVNPDAVGRNGQTPLSWAAKRGHEEIVKMLLKRDDVKPDTLDEMGRTPFSWAVIYGHAEVVKMLLEQNGVNPDTADKNGQTPLSWAAGRGHEEIVKMLLEQTNINPDTVDRTGRTPLSWAAESGYEGIAEMLLQRGDVNPDMADDIGWTPLSFAVTCNWEGIVVMLVEQGNANPSTADIRGRTPLSLAAENGCRGIAEMLLEQNGLDPDTPDEGGRTPLSWAAEHWQMETMKILLDRNGVNPNGVDERGRTPLTWAAVGWAEDLRDLDPDTEGKSDRTHFLWAARDQCERAAKMLLERNNVNPDIADRRGRTPLSWTASRGHGEIVKALLERNDVNPDTLDERGLTPLSWAVIYGHVEVVKMLLKRDNVNPDMADKSGRTPLSWARMYKQEGIVEILLERNNANSATVDGWARAPSSAAGNEHEGIIDIMLEANDVSPDLVDENSPTPFPPSAENRCARVAQLLEGQQELVAQPALLTRFCEQRR